jgi:MinD-like ATPase involved in chromosome partitioning or flagellar assembly
LRDPGDRRGLRRADLYAGRLAEGRLEPAGAWRPLVRSLRSLRSALRGGTAREEALGRRLSATATLLTRPNHVVVVSPKGGVGKTTCTLLAGEVLARRVRLRCVAVDANPDYGTLGLLAPDALRSERSLADLLRRGDELDHAGALRPFVSPLPSGLHLLAAPADPRAMADLGPDHYRDLIELLDRFYEVVLLDLGTGLTDPLAHFALERADQMLVVSTAEWVCAERVLAALDHLRATRAGERATVVLNQAPPARAVERQVIEAAFRRHEVGARVAIPYEPRLRAMLDAGALELDGLPRAMRIAIERLGLAVAEALS